MWFLVRMAFWLSVVSLLLPVAPSQKTTSVPQGGTRGMSAAESLDKSARKTPQDTLAPADLAVPWRGPRLRKQSERRQLHQRIGAITIASTLPSLAALTMGLIPTEPAS
jgi:hypothetical protein